MAIGRLSLVPAFNSVPFHLLICPQARMSPMGVSIGACPHNGVPKYTSTHSLVCGPVLTHMDMCVSVYHSFNPSTCVCSCTGYCLDPCGLSHTCPAACSHVLRGRGCGSMVEEWPSRSKPLGSNLSTAEDKRGHCHHMQSLHVPNWLFEARLSFFIPRKTRSLPGSVSGPFLERQPLCCPPTAIHPSSPQL